MLQQQQQQHNTHPHPSPSLVPAPFPMPSAVLHSIPVSTLSPFPSWPSSSHPPFYPSCCWAIASRALPTRMPRLAKPWSLPLVSPCFPWGVRMTKMMTLMPMHIFLSNHQKKRIPQHYWLLLLLPTFPRHRRGAWPCYSRTCFWILLPRRGKMWSTRIIRPWIPFKWCRASIPLPGSLRPSVSWWADSCPPCGNFIRPIRTWRCIVWPVPSCRPWGNCLYSKPSRYEREKVTWWCVAKEPSCCLTSTFLSFSPGVWAGGIYGDHVSDGWAYVAFVDVASLWKILTNCVVFQFYRTCVPRAVRKTMYSTFAIPFFLTPLFLFCYHVSFSIVMYHTVLVSSFRLVFPRCSLGIWSSPQQPGEACWFC